jgi:hypothetical protein
MTDHDPFLDAFRGRFAGILRWEQLDELWKTLPKRATAGLYVYRVGETPPDRPLVGQELIDAIGEIDHVLRRDHDEDYCGIVYVDDREKPSFVKVFDPNRLGVVCGIGGDRVLPGWTLSTLRPTDLEQALQHRTEHQPWWRRWVRP